MLCFCCSTPLDKQLSWSVLLTVLCFCCSTPLDKRQAHVEGARSFRWSRCHESLLATLGRPQRQIKVFNTRHQQVKFYFFTLFCTFISSHTNHTYMRNQAFFHTQNPLWHSENTFCQPNQLLSYINHLLSDMQVCFCYTNHPLSHANCLLWHQSILVAQVSRQVGVLCPVKPATFCHTAVEHPLSHKPHSCHIQTTLYFFTFCKPLSLFFTFLVLYVWVTPTWLCYVILCAVCVYVFGGGCWLFFLFLLLLFSQRYFLFKCALFM